MLKVCSIEVNENEFLFITTQPEHLSNHILHRVFMTKKTRTGILETFKKQMWLKKQLLQLPFKCLNICIDYSYLSTNPSFMASNIGMPILLLFVKTNFFLRCPICFIRLFQFIQYLCQYCNLLSINMEMFTYNTKLPPKRRYGKTEPETHSCKCLTKT